MKIWILLFSFFCIFNMDAQETKDMDSTLTFFYGFHISNKKLFSKTDGYTWSYLSKDSLIWITKSFSDSVLSNKQITFNNKFGSDSLKYSYDKGNNIDSCIWLYDSLNRETKYVWFGNDEQNKTLTWYYEYHDTIQNSIVKTTKSSFRVDHYGNTKDTCCQRITDYYYDEGLLIKEKETDDVGETSETEYFYDSLGNLINMTKKMYNNYEGVFINRLSEDSDKCFHSEVVDFPKSILKGQTADINAYLEKYLDTFFHLDCKPETLRLESKDGKTELYLTRGDCHSANAGRIRLTIKK